MAKVLWHTTMSLDGFVAGPGGGMSWLAGNTGANPTVDEVLGRIGALLIGNRTFGGDAGAQTEAGRPYGGAWTGPMFVLTHHPPAAPVPGFTFVTDLAGAVTAAKAAAGDGYVAVLGGRTAAACLDAGLLDEVLVHVAPVLLGDGVRLFDRPGGTAVRLEPVQLTNSSRVANLWLRVVY
jgi:dihydrofolate reductase